MGAMPGTVLPRHRHLTHEPLPLPPHRAVVAPMHPLVQGAQAAMAWQSPLTGDEAWRRGHHEVEESAVNPFWGFWSLGLHRKVAGGDIPFDG